MMYLDSISRVNLARDWGQDYLMYFPGRVNHFGRVSSKDEKRVCSRETRSQREHIFMHFNRLTRE